MPNIETDDRREDRIDMEIVVDAYNAEERAMGWYYYLDKHLNFPFKAIWISGTSQEEVEVVGMSPEEFCSQEMFVEALYKEGSVADTFSVPLSNIEAVDANAETQEGIADWHYWLEQGYEF